MHWIEQLLHVSPDGGNGTTEFVISLVVVTAATLSVLGIGRSARVRAIRRALSRRSR